MIYIKLGVDSSGFFIGTCANDFGGQLGNGFVYDVNGLALCDM